MRARNVRLAAGGAAVFAAAALAACGSSATPAGTTTSTPSAGAPSASTPAAAFKPPIPVLFEAVIADPRVRLHPALAATAGTKAALAVRCVPRPPGTGSTTAGDR